MVSWSSSRHSCACTTRRLLPPPIRVFTTCVRPPQISLPRLVDVDWRVDVKTSANTVSRMATPTALVQMQVRAPRLARIDLQCGLSTHAPADRQAVRAGGRRGRRGVRELRGLARDAADDARRPGQGPRAAERRVGGWGGFAAAGGAGRRGRVCSATRHVFVCCRLPCPRLSASCAAARLQ